VSPVTYLSVQEFRPNCKRLFTLAVFYVCVNFIWSESKVQIVAVPLVKVYVAWRNVSIDSSLSTTSTRRPGRFTPVPNTRAKRAGEDILVKRETSCPSQELNRDFSDQFKAYPLTD
jgi:hypothetical protein